MRAGPGTLVVGNTSTGPVTVSAAIIIPTATDLIINTARGNNIAFSGPGYILSAGGNVTLSTSGTGAITTGSALCDILAGTGTISVAAGSGGIGASGSPLIVAGTNLDATTTNGNQYLQAVGSITVDPTGLSAGSATIQLDGSTFTLGGSNRTNPSSQLTVETGTLAIGASSETVSALTLVSGSITGTTGVLTSTGTIQTQSGTITANLAGSNGLTQSGSGSTVLSGANSYSGPTTVSGGTLLVNGNDAGATGAVSVNGGVLGGTGTLGGVVTVNTGGTITGGALGGVGTLTVGGLAFDGGAYQADVLANTSDTLAILAGGTVNLAAPTPGAFTLNNLGGPTSAGTVFTFIQNAASGAVAIENTPLAGASEGGTVAVNTQGGTYTYLGGTGGKNFTLTIGSGTVSVLGGNITLTLDSTGTLLDEYQGTKLISSQLLSTVTSFVYTDITGTANTFTVDYSNGFFATPITFNGNNVSGEQLIVTGYSDVTVTETDTTTGPGDSGQVTIPNGSSSNPATDTITYSGLSLVNLTGLTGSNLVVNLPGGGTSALLGDDGTPGNGVTEISQVAGTPFATTTFTNPTSSLNINPGSPTDAITVGGLPDFTAGLTLAAPSDSATPFGAITFTGAVTAAAVVSGYALGPIDVNASATIATSGAYSDDGVDLTSAESIVVAPGGSITTVGGYLDLYANQQSVPTAGSFVGVLVGGTVQSANGAISVSGTGGTGAGGEQYGVEVTGLIEGGTDTTSVVTGTGGAGAGGSDDGVYVAEQGQITTVGSGGVIVNGTGGSGAAGTYDNGVVVFGTGSAIASAGGPVSVTGMGGGSTSGYDSDGVNVLGAGEIFAAGSGSVTVSGTGGPGSGGYDYGVWVSGPQSLITSDGGAVAVTGEGGGSAGTSNLFDNMDNYGVDLDNRGEILSGGSGLVTLTGTGGSGAGGVNDGVYLDGESQITSGGSGMVTVLGTGGSGVDGGDVGVELIDPGTTITSGGGAVSVTGQGGTFSGAEGVFLDTSTQITSGGNGSVTVTGTATSGSGVEVDLGLITSGGTGSVTVMGTDLHGTESGYGVLVEGSEENFLEISSAPSQITSSGPVTVVGTGASGGIGVWLDDGVISSNGDAPLAVTGTVSGTQGGVGVDLEGLSDIGSSGSVTISGTGGSGGTGDNYGVEVIGLISSGLTGATVVTGTAGPSSSGGSNIGVDLGDGEIMSGGSGSVTVTGTGAAGSGGEDSGVEDSGVELDGEGQITSGGSGSVTVIGTGGAGGYTGGGVYVNGGEISSGGENIFTGAVASMAGGPVAVTGVGTSTSIGVVVENGGSINTVYDGTTSSAPITITADSLYITGSTTVINSGTSTTTLVTYTPGTTFNLGGTYSLTGSPLAAGLTTAELSEIKAGTVAIGNSSTGPITVSAVITFTAKTNLVLTTGAGNTIVFSGSAAINSDGGNVTLSTSGTGAITPGTASPDITAGAGTISLTAGSGGIGASGYPLIVSATNLDATTTNGNQYLQAVGSITVDPTGLSAGSATIQLDGGTFMLGGSNLTNPSSQLTVETGTLATGASSETVSALTLVSGSITGTSGVLTSTGTIQTESGTITANLAGSNGLTQSSSGSTVLSGANSYAGPTMVSGGALLVNGNDAGATGAVSVNGGVLGGTGTLGGVVTVNTGGTITGGVLGGVGTLTVGGLSFDGGTYAADINGNTSDTIQTGGTVNLANPTAGTFTLNSVVGTLTAPVFLTFIDSTGTAIQNSFSNLTEEEVAQIGGQVGAYTYRGGTGNDLVFRTINGPTANSQHLSIAENSTNDTITLTGTDPNTPPLSLTYTVTVPPTHGTLSGTAPNLTYTPTPGYFGTDSFQFIDSNELASSSSATISLTIVGTPTANAQSVTLAENAASSITLTGTDPNTPTLSLSYTVTVPPSHGTLSGTAPNLTYTPTPGYFGTDSFQFTDTNGVATSPPATISLTVVGIPTANAQSVSLAEDTASSITLTGTDPNTPPLSLTDTVTVPPSHGTLSGTAPNLIYTPTPGYFGTDSFQFTDTNGTAASTAATVSVAIVGTPTANAQSVTLAEGASSAITLTGTDPNTPPLSLTYTVTVPPTHGTLSGTAPNLTYTPTPGYFGTDSFQFTDTNGTATSSTATVSLTIVGTPTANAQSVTLAENAASSITLTGTDPNTPSLSLTYAVTVAPSHGTLSGTAPNLTYTPTSGYFGTDSFQFTDTNGTATSSAATVSLTIIGTPTANAQSVTLAENGASAIRLTGTDPNTPPLSLTYIVTVPPSHGTLSGTAPNLIYTSTPGYFGTDSFQFTDTNGVDTSLPAIISLTIVGIPTARAQSVTLAENAASSITLTGTDPNTPPLSLTYKVTTPPIHGTLSGTAPNLTYTPTPGYFGTDSFQFTDTNGTATSSAATVSLAVIGIPTARTQSVTLAENAASAVTLTGTDPDRPPLSLTYTVTVPPSHGALSGTAPNLTYTPTPGYSGTDSFQFTDTNGVDTSLPAIISLTIVGIPTAHAQSVTLAENATSSITLTGTDPNTPPLSLTYKVTIPPIHGTLSGTAPNLTYTPTSGYFGTDSIQFTDTNGTATSSAATVSLTIIGTPTATAQSVTLAENSASAITLTGTDPITRLSLTYTVAVPPTHGTLSGTAPNLTYTPTPGYFGTDSFQFTDTNGTATSSAATISLTIIGTPTAAAQSVAITEDIASAITLTGTDPNTPPLSLRYAITGTPSHGTLSGTAPNLTYTPRPGYVGTDSFQFTVTNGTITSPAATVSLAVNLAPEPLLIGGQPNGTVAVEMKNSSGQYTLTETLTPFGPLTTDVRTAVGDVNGDGIPDYIFATGPGTPFEVTVLSGAPGNAVLVAPFDPFLPAPPEAQTDLFTAGGFVSAGDFLGNGRDQIVVSPDQSGGPRISIYDMDGAATAAPQPHTAVGVNTAEINPGSGLTRINNFLSVNADFRGGARTAAGDLNGDGVPDLAIAAGFGGGPAVLVINGTKVATTNGFTASDDLIGDFFAFSSSLRDGAYLAIGDVLGNGQQDLILGPGAGGPAEVEILSGAQIVNDGAIAAIANPVALFTPTGLGPDGSGMRVAVAATGARDQVDVAVGAGRNMPGVAKVYPGTSFTSGSTSEPTGGQFLSPFGGTVLTDGIFVG